MFDVVNAFICRSKSHVNRAEAISNKSKLADKTTKSCIEFLFHSGLVALLVPLVLLQGGISGMREDASDLS